MAGVQVELDILKDWLTKIWIATEGEDGFRQKIVYDHILDYCRHCWHIGHFENSCDVQHPELQKESRFAEQSDRGADHEALSRLPPMDTAGIVAAQESLPKAIDQPNPSVIINPRSATVAERPSMEIVATGSHRRLLQALHRRLLQVLHMQLMSTLPHHSLLLHLPHLLLLTLPHRSCNPPHQYLSLPKVFYVYLRRWVFPTR